MQKMTRLGVAGLAVMVTASVVWAQQAPPVRIRGEITKVEGNTLSIKSRTGENLTVKLAEPMRVSAMVKSSLADIKEGTFIGVSAMPMPDGTQKAYAIHIFLETQKGVVADRFDPTWDNRPGATMTNANVATTVSGKDGQDLLVKYKDGEKKVFVADNTPVVTFVPGDKSDLKAGAKVIAFMKQLPDGSFETNRVSVGRDGLTPPM
jgi:hypothetical protein